MVVKKMIECWEVKITMLVKKEIDVSKKEVTEDIESAMTNCSYEIFELDTVLN